MKFDNCILFLSLIFICINPLESKKVVLLKDNIYLNCRDNIIFDISEEIKDNIESNNLLSNTNTKLFSNFEKFMFISIINYPNKNNEGYNDILNTIFLDGDVYDINKGKNIFLLDYYIFNTNLYNSSVYINCSSNYPTFMKIKYNIFTNVNTNVNTNVITYTNVNNISNKSNNSNYIEQKNIYDIFKTNFINYTTYISYYYQHNLLLNLITFSGILIILRYMH